MAISNCLKAVKLNVFEKLQQLRSNKQKSLFSMTLYVIFNKTLYYHDVVTYVYLPVGPLEEKCLLTRHEFFLVGDC